MKGLFSNHICVRMVAIKMLMGMRSKFIFLIEEFYGLAEHIIDISTLSLFNEVAKKYLIKIFLC